MNNQEAFDLSAAHLLKQGKKSFEMRWAADDDDGGMEEEFCLYRGDGIGCAMYPLIPDDMYNEDMEGRTIGGIISEYVSLGAYLRGVSGDVLRGLQNIHDNVDPKHWADQLAGLAQSHNLSTLVIDNFEGAPGSKE